MYNALTESVVTSYRLIIKTTEMFDIKLLKKLSQDIVI